MRHLSRKKHWAIPGEIETEGVEYMEFQGVLKKQHVKISGVN